MLKHYLSTCLLITPITIICVFTFSYAQMPNPALLGYFHNWNTTGAPYIQPTQIDNRYNVIEIAFALPKPGSDYDMEFTPDILTPGAFLTQIQTLQSQGKKVLISIGGATATVKLDNTAERDTFVSSMNSIINSYGFDGIDIDLEGSSVNLSGGTISTPVDSSIIYLIEAIEQLMIDYRNTNGEKMLLTMAPETAFVQGGQSAYGGIWGAYLPIIEALRDSIDILQVQLYNSGTMYGIDGIIYSQGTADFIVAMTEAVIQGFNTGGGLYSGLAANKVAIALPACSLAAGGGYTHPDTVKAAIEYLLGTGTKPGSYTLLNASGYPDLAGMMTWSINWDAVNTCNGVYEYAQLFEDVFSVPVGIHQNAFANAFIYPNPSADHLSINLESEPNAVTLILSDMNGKILFNQQRIRESSITLDVSSLTKGMYILKLTSKNKVGQFKVLKI